MRFPDDHLSVLCLCNGYIDSRRLSRRVADLFLPSDGTAEAANPTKTETSVSSRPASPAPAGVASSPESLAAIGGDYLSPKDDIWSFVVESGVLVLHRGELRMELAPAGARRFRSRQPDWGWQFQFDGEGSARPGRVVLSEKGEQDFVYSRIPDPPAATALKPYLGRYDDDELRNPYTIARSGAGLRLETAIQPNGPLRWLGGDRFLLDSPFFTLIFRFTRGADGSVDGFVLDAGSANGFRFDRIGSR